MTSSHSRSLPNFWGGDSLDVCVISRVFLTFVLDTGGLALRTYTSGFGIMTAMYIVWEPYGDNSRWWIGPLDENAPHIPLNELERALSRS